MSDHQALYKASLWTESACEYVSEEGDCEHVGLHKCMKQQFKDAKFFMLPAFKIVYQLKMSELYEYRANTQPRGVAR